MICCAFLYLLFVQRANNSCDLVPIAICCSLLDASLDRAP